MAVARIGVVALVAVVAGAAGLLASAGADGGDGRPLPGVQVAGPGVPSASGQAASFDDPRTDGYQGLAPGPTPDGKVPVAFSADGVPGLAGYVDAASEDLDAVVPALGLRSVGRELRGWDVTDREGALVGYFVTGIGFVDLATARDPERLDALVAWLGALEDAHPPPEPPAVGEGGEG